MLKVINEFGLASLQLSKDDFMKPELIIQLGYEPVRIDIINDLNGVPFDEAWINKKIVDISGVPVNFIGYDDLLKVKSNAGRPQDLADIHKLKKRKSK